MSPIFFASADEAPFAASWMRSAVRFAVSSVRIAPLLHELRSGGISVDLIQLPFAYRKKSSPGFTVASIPAASRPCSGVGSFAAAVADVWGGADAQPNAKARMSGSLGMAAHPATAGRAVVAVVRTPIRGRAPDNLPAQA